MHLKQTRFLAFWEKNLKSCDKKTKAIAYKMLVWPKLDYCSSIWDPHKQTLVEQVEKVQHWATCFVKKDYRWETRITQLLQFRWEKLEVRRIKSRLAIIFKELNHLAPSYIDLLRTKREVTGHNRQPRNDHPNNLKRIIFSKNCYKYSLYWYTIPEWNLLPVDIKGSSDLIYFKTKIETINVEYIAKKAHFKC